MNDKEATLNDFLAWCSRHPGRGSDHPPMGILTYWVNEYLAQRR